MMKAELISAKTLLLGRVVLHKVQYLTINRGCLSLSDPVSEIMNGFRQFIEEAIALLGAGNTDEI